MNEIRTQRGDSADNPQLDSRAYEESDVNPVAAGLTLGTVVALIIIGCAAVAAMLLWFGAMRDSAPERIAISGAPALQIDERADRAEIEGRGRARLQGKTGGSPVEEAMRRTMAAGWDAPR